MNFVNTLCIHLRLNPVMNIMEKFVELFYKNEYMIHRIDKSDFKNIYSHSSNNNVGTS